ncbi:MAG: DUF3604 domain-containing protein [Promethearchaeia archaeon]
MKKKNILRTPQVLKDGPRKKSVKWIFIFIFLFVGFYFWTIDPVNFNWRPLVKNDPAQLRVFGPSIVQQGESEDFTVECWDYCERLSCGYSGSVEFSAVKEKAGSNGTLVSTNVNFSRKSYKFKPSSFSQGMVEAYRFPWGDGGMKTFSVQFTEPGIHYLVAEDKDNEMKAYSNPIVVHEEKPEDYLLWGDIHGHTSKCDGSGNLDTVLYYAKNVACLDFASITTHDHFVNALVSPLGWKVNWEHTKSVVEQWNGKDNFVTLQAYEWRGNYLGSGNTLGDRVIYSRTSEVPFFSGAEQEYTNEKLLNEALKNWMAEKEERKVMTIAHHPPHTMMGMKTDWSYFDPEITRLVEMYSVHGSSEMSTEQGNNYPLMGGTDTPQLMETDEPGYHIRDALSMGYHLGFMASGDSHDGHIGHSLSHTEARHLWQAPLSYTAFPNHMFRCHQFQQNGLIGVFAPSLERGDIFDAMWKRACYATKGTSRPYVNFSINGTRIGESNSIISVEDNSVNRLIELDVAAGGGDANTLKKIQIIRNNEVWKELDFSNDKKIFHGSWVDTDPLEGLSYWDYRDIDPEENKRDGEYYIHDEADIGVDEADELSTNGETFYYIKVFTEGSSYYDGIFDSYNRELIPRGDDVAWVGPLWVRNV